MAQITVVKVGGGVLEDPASSKQFLKAFISIDGVKLLVHGGGRLADQYLLKLGIQPNMVNGRRVTDKATMEVVTMVYGGLVNKQLVTQLQRHNVNAIGLTGADGNIIVSEKRPVKDIDWGWVGDPTKVNEPMLTGLLQQTLVPVIAPLTHDGVGNLLNTNADTMATVVAIALATRHEVTLVFAFDKPGVLTDVDDDASVIATMNKQDYVTLKSTGQIHSGMIPKLENAFEALEKGIGKIRIAGFDALADEAAGTTLQLQK